MLQEAVIESNVSSVGEDEKTPAELEAYLARELADFQYGSLEYHKHRKAILSQYRKGLLWMKQHLNEKQKGWCIRLYAFKQRQPQPKGFWLAPSDEITPLHTKHGWVLVPKFITVYHEALQLAAVFGV